jgi:hypothetical protein
MAASSRGSDASHREFPPSLAEGYDTERGRLAGNFPQAFSHVGLINTAFNLSRRLAPAVERDAESRGNSHAAGTTSSDL